MPLLVQHPAYFSKSRLKSDLVAHNVALPPAKSKKEVYVELYLKHIDQRSDFSSDEEDLVQDVTVENPVVAEEPDPRDLTDDDLKAKLLEHGVKAGPILASTRAVYEKKLRKLLQSDRHDRVNGAEKGVLYSDSEEEEESEQDEDAESGSEGKSQTVEQLEEQENSQNGDFTYPQCFLLSSRLHVPASRNREPDSKGNALKSSARSLSQNSWIPVGISRSSSVDRCSGVGSVVPPGSQSVSSQAFSITQMVEEMESQRALSTSSNTEGEVNGSNVQEHWPQSDRLDMPVVDEYYTPKASPYNQTMKEPLKDTFKDLLPDNDITPTRIYATCRRPIKGAAGRPVQYAYPETPASPITLERREVERHLVPIHIQIVVFLIVACLLYLIYDYAEDNSLGPFVSL
uniref:LEM domain-containing protein 1 isoform X2 n=1 Tax=Monopterus albus TaxID=43700 RepID=UPI0009B485E2|nr:lamina-associated polypeptide 2, isoforms beta/gamma-like isoform X2 [Monopterus albus]